MRIRCFRFWSGRKIETIRAKSKQVSCAEMVLVIRFFACMIQQLGFSTQKI